MIKRQRLLEPVPQCTRHKQGRMTGIILLRRRHYPLNEPLALAGFPCFQNINRSGLIDLPGVACRWLDCDTPTICHFHHAWIAPL
jgi:hypothetical protein